MRSKFLSFLLVMACAALIGLGPVRAQNSTSSNDSNGSAVATPAHHADPNGSAVSPTSSATRDQAASDARRDANTAVSNDLGTVPNTTSEHAGFKTGWIGLLGLLGFFGLLGLKGRRNVRSSREIRDVDGAEEIERRDYPRAA